jgi:hypothetical protein
MYSGEAEGYFFLTWYILFAIWIGWRLFTYLWRRDWRLFTYL